MTAVHSMFLTWPEVWTFMTTRQELVESGCSWLVHTTDEKYSIKKWRKAKKAVLTIYGNLISFLNFFKTNMSEGFDVRDFVHSLESLEKAVQCMDYYTRFFDIDTDPTLPLRYFLFAENFPKDEEWAPEGPGWIEKENEIHAP